MSTSSELAERLREAYIAGATAVHEHFTAYHPDIVPRGDPEFGEAASDYAALASTAQPPDEPMMTPEQEAEIVEDINSGRWPYLQPLAQPPVSETVAWATGHDKDSGWTLAPTFIRKLSKDALAATGYETTWEVLEHVFLAGLNAAPQPTTTVLREALTFYALKANWNDGMLLEHIPSSVEADGGKIACAALTTKE